jgi:hypothetical protein
MTKYLLVAMLYMAYSKAEAQAKSDAKDSLGNAKSTIGGIAFNRFGVCTIKLKDGTRLINCALKAVNANSISYIKNRVMHDMAIDRIKCIVPENDYIVVWFDEKNNAVAANACP